MRWTSLGAAAAAASCLFGSPTAALGGTDLRDTPGVVRGSPPNWLLSNWFGTPPFHNFTFQSGTPVVGDWNGDGTDTPGVVIDGRHWLLSNGYHNVIDYNFIFGDPGDVPVVGDWDGNGTDTPGLKRGSVWFLSNDFAATVHHSFGFGDPSDTPITGDWNGNGTDTPGLHRGNGWYLSDDFAGTIHQAFAWGNYGDRPLAGDWNGDGIDTVGVFRSGDWHLTDWSYGGPANYSFTYGLASDTPVVGDWSDAPQNQQAAVVVNNSTEFAIQNADGTWRIAKQCLGSGSFGTDPNWPHSQLMTGPGYIYRVTTASGSVLVDDWAKPVLIPGRPPNQASISVDTFGGLGAFAWHHARDELNPTQFWLSDGRAGWPPLNAWPVSSRICAANHPQTTGFGVARASVFQQPTYDAAGVLRLGVLVELRTPHVDPLIRLYYHYQFHSSVVKVWTRVVTSSVSTWEFAKEPKFSAEVNSAFGFQRIFVRSDSTTSHPLGGSWIAPEYFGTGSGTGQQGDASRARVYFTRQTTPQGSASCDSVEPCLQVIARAAAAGGDGTTTFRWEQSGYPSYGLDNWAAQASSLPRVNTEDGPGENIDWGCNGSFDPLNQIHRRWEFVGNWSPSWPHAALFHGWEGGVGPYDCEPLSRFLPGAEFSQQFQYSVNTGGTIP